MAIVGPIEVLHYGGTGGVSGKDYTFSPSATIPVGTLIVGYLTDSASGIVASISDNSSQAGTANVYNLITPNTQPGIKARGFYCYSTRPILATDVIKISLIGTGSAKDARILTFTGTSSTPLDLSGDTNGSTTQTISVTSSPLAQSGELAIMFTVTKVLGIASGFSDSTSGWTAGTASTGSGGSPNTYEVNYSYRNGVGTAAVTDTHDFTNAVNNASEILTFKAFAAPVIKNLICVSSSTSSGNSVIVRNRKTGARSANTSISVSGITKTAGHVGVQVNITAWSKLELFLGTDLYLGPGTIIGGGFNSPTFSTVNKVAVGSNKTFGAVSSNFSSATSSIVRNRKTSATGFGTSTGKVGVFIQSSDNWPLACFSTTNTSSGTISLTRVRKTPAVSVGATVYSTTKISRNRKFAVTQGLFVLGGYTLGGSMSSGTVNLVAAPISAYSSGSSTGRTGIVRTRKLTALSNSSSGGTCAPRRNRSTPAISSGTSTALAGIGRLRIFAARSATTSSGFAAVPEPPFVPISGGTSTGRATFTRTRALTCRSFNTSSGLVAITRTRNITTLSTGTSTGVCSVSRNKKIVAISSGSSTGKTIISVGFVNLIVRSNSTSSGRATLGKSLAFRAFSGYGLDGFVLDSDRIDRSNSAATAFVSTAGLAAVSRSISTGTTKLSRNIKPRAVSTGNSSGSVVVSRNRFVTFSANSSQSIYVSPDTYIGPNTYLGATSDSWSKLALLTFQDAPFDAAISTGSSSGVANLGRLYTFTASSYGGVGGIQIGTYQIGSNNSTGNVNIILNPISANSSGTSTGRAIVRRTRNLFALSSGSSTGCVTLVRNRKSAALSTGTSTGVVDNITAVTRIDAVSTGSSTGTTNITRTRAFAARSVSNSTAVVSTIRTRTFAALANDTSTGRVNVARNRAFAAVSSGTSTGIVTTAKIASFAAVATGTSSALTGVARTRAFAAISSGTSSGKCSVLKDRGLTSIASGNSRSIASFALSRTINAITNDTSGAYVFIFKEGEHFYNASGNSSVRATFAISHVLNAVSSASSSAQTIISRNRPWVASSASNSTGVASAARTRAFAAISGGSSTGTVLAIVSRNIKAVSTSASTINVKLTSPRNITATSVNSSTSTVTFTGGSVATYESNSTSTAKASMLLVRGLHAESNNTSSARATFSTARNITAVSRDTSAGIWHTAESLALTCLSDSRSTGKSTLALNREFSADANGDSSGEVTLQLNIGTFAYSDGTSTGDFITEAVRGLTTFSVSESAASVHLGLNQTIFGNSTGDSTGTAHLGSLFIYGTVEIWDESTYTVEVYDLVNEAISYDI